jgi:N-acetylglucosamine-6-phosphate deacetylase
LRASFLSVYAFGDLKMDDGLRFITNARLVLFDRIIERAWVQIENGRIQKTGQAEFGPEIGRELVDVAGATVFPGFVDVHMHGAVGVDTMNATADGLAGVSRFLATKGVTSWLPTLVPGSEYEYQSALQSVSEIIERRGSSQARIVGVHYEGPFVNLEQCGALHRDYFRSYQQGTDLGLPRLKAGSGRMMMTIAPEVAGGIDLIQKLHQEGWIISIGHTRASADILDQAFAAGARHMTHFMNAMAPLHHRNPGPVGWGLSRDDVTCDIIADGIHLDPFVLKLLMKVKGAQRLALISDAIAAAGEGDGEYRIWGETIAVKNGRTRNVHGSLAGSVITMLDAFRLMRSLGAADVELAQMASTNPARLIGIDNECGSIEEGKRADLVAINDDGDVKLTLIGGEVAFRA